MSERLVHRISDGWRLDARSRAPAYAQIEARLIGLIADGALQVGDRLPAERLIASSLGVSRMTVRHAMGSLARQGLLERGVGRGTFVASGRVEHDPRRGTSLASRRVEHDLRRVAGFTEQMERLNLAPGALIVSARQRRPTLAVARMLQIAATAPAYRIQRVRFGDRVALTLEDSWIPAHRFPGLLEQDLRGSLYALMRDVYDLTPVHAVEHLGAVAARAREAEALDVEPGSPLVLVERTTYAHDDIQVEHARDVHRGDRVSFMVEAAAHIPPRHAPDRGD
ncbi:MAG: GntR family transcriptional regulator [Solirubrobacteraceae bacterium]